MREEIKELEKDEDGDEDEKVEDNDDEEESQGTDALLRLIEKASGRTEADCRATGSP